MEARWDLVRNHRARRMAVRSKTERSSVEAKGGDEETSGAGGRADLVITNAKVFEDKVYVQ